MTSNHLKAVSVETLQPSGTPVSPDSLPRVNQVKTRLQSLGLLDRTISLATDAEITALVEALDEDHLDALTELVLGETDPVHIRDAASRGRLDGTMEGIIMVITDACLADCIEQLGDHADHPSTEDLQGVLPGLIERHGLAATRMMLASTVAGEAPAAPIIRDLLKNDDVLKLPPVESRPVVAPAFAAVADDPEREAIKAKRKEAKARKQAEAKTRREQAQNAKRR